MFQFSSLCRVLALAFLLSAVTLCDSLSSFPKLCDVRNYDDYLQQTGKVLRDEQERVFRESIFKAKQAVVDMGNKYAALGLMSFNMALNPLADLTQSEVAKLFGSKITFKGE